jgi:DNA repair exonuclease SbcCD ATPase subunit
MSTEEYNENEEFEPQDSYESDYEEEEEKPRKGSRVVLIIAVAALVGLNVFLGWNIYSQTEKLKEKEAEIAELDAQRVMLLAKVDSLSTHVASLTTAAAEKDTSLANLRTELETLKAQLTDKDKYIATLEDYKRKYKDYLTYKKLAAEKEAEIEKLKAEKEAAIARAQEAENANDTLTQRLNEINDEKAQLENKVSLGKRLTGSIKELKSFGERRGKQKDTDKASQVTRLQVKYSIAANAIADKGNKTVYIIVKNGSKTFTEDGFEFELDGGKKLSYTHKDEVKYNGKDTDSSPSFNLPSGLSSGKYTVEVYVDSKLLGSSEFELR